MSQQRKLPPGVGFLPDLAIDGVSNNIPKVPLVKLIPAQQGGLTLHEEMVALLVAIYSVPEFSLLVSRGTGNAERNTCPTCWIDGMAAKGCRLVENV